MSTAITTTPATINTNAARRIAAYTKGKPLETVLEAYNARKSNYADITTKVDATNSRIVPSVHPINGKFTFLDREKGLHYRPTRHAYSQLSQKFKIGISTILKLEASESPEYHACLQNLIKIHFESEAENKNFLFRLNDSDNSCRALLSDKYAIVNNSWMLDQIQRYLPEDAKSHVVTDLSTEDYLSFSVFIPSSEAIMDDSNYGGLIKFTNSEIGTHRLTLEAGILRLVCTNGMIGVRGQAGLNVVHRGTIDLRHIQSLIQSGIQDHMAAMPRMIEGFQRTKHFTLGNDGSTMTPLFASVAQAYKLTQLEIEATHTGWGIERSETPQYARTLFGIANSITRGSQRLPEISNTKMNEIGGELGQFSHDEWIGLRNKANALQVKDCESILGRDLIFA